jgi:2-iminobutanoate/2-iminopropanoate deaminase
MLYISGQVARNREGANVGVGDMRAQAEQVFLNLQEILKAHGSSFEHAVKATLYITRMELAHEVVAVRSRYYRQARPASTFVGVTALNDPDWWLEVELIAVAPRGAA